MIELKFGMINQMDNSEKLIDLFIILKQINQINVGISPDHETTSNLLFL